MSDEHTTIAALVADVARFRDERDWARFHTPRNLASAIITEAAELLEPFRWGENVTVDKIAEELADVLYSPYRWRRSAGWTWKPSYVIKWPLTRVSIRSRPHNSRLHGGAGGCKMVGHR